MLYEKKKERTTTHSRVSRINVGGFGLMYDFVSSLIKFIYSEKATKFYEIFPLLLTVYSAVKSKEKIPQNFVVCMNFIIQIVSGFFAINVTEPFIQ